MGRISSSPGVVTVVDRAGARSAAVRQDRCAGAGGPDHPAWPLYSGVVSVFVPGDAVLVLPGGAQIATSASYQASFEGFARRKLGRPEAAGAGTSITTCGMAGVTGGPWTLPPLAWGRQQREGWHTRKPRRPVDRVSGQSPRCCRVSNGEHWRRLSTVSAAPRSRKSQQTLDALGELQVRRGD
jgi:hypothetical protein